MADISYGGNYREGADPRLIEILEKAAAAQGLLVEFTSGYRPGDKRQHGKGNALDVTLIDPDTGKRLPNYQNASSFRTYEQFAQTARQIQRKEHPDLDRAFRWGGYFSGPKGKYGALDLMHFDLAGERVGMAGGTWERGLTKKQRELFPGVESYGFKDHPVPQVNIPDVASLTDTRTAYAPTPARKSSALEAITGATGGRVASPGIPSAYDSPKTPQQVASLYEGILPARNGLSAFPGGPAPIPRSPTLFGDTVGIPDDMMSTRPDGTLDPSYRLYGPDNRMSVGGLGSLLGGRTIPPAMPNSPPVRPTTSPPGFGLSSAQRTAMAALPSVPSAPTVGGVGGANIAGQVQLPRNVVPASVQRDLAAINALPSLPSPFDTIGAFPSALSLAQMRTTGRAPIPMPTISRSGSPFPASYAQMQSARSRYAAPIPASRRSVVAPIPASRLVAPVPATRSSSRTASDPELQAVHDYIMGTGRYAGSSLSS